MINAMARALIRVIIYDILFSMFVFFVEPSILPHFKGFAFNPYASPEPVYWVGILILTALAAEVPGVYFKFRAIGSRMLKEGRGKPGDYISLKWGMLLSFLHAAIAVSMMIHGFMAFGLGMHQNENLFGLFFLLALTREGVLFYFFNFSKVPGEEMPGVKYKSIIADMCLFFYGIMAYTATWRVIPESTRTLTADSWAVFALLLFFSAVLFLMFYVSSNMATVFESFLSAHTRRQLLYRFGSLLIVVASVFGPMCQLPGHERKTVPDFRNHELIEKQKAEEILRHKNQLKVRDGLSR